MRIGIVGAGIAGLTAAHILSRMPAHEVVLYERESTAGGRASLRDSGAHCPRVFLDDYRDLFRVLGEVRQADATTLSSAVVPLDRFYYTSRGEWVRISRLFGFQAPELALRDRLGITRAGWSSAVLAEYPAAVNTNKYSPGSNWSGPTLAKAAWKVLRSGGALALEGPTDTCLIEPWLTDLAGHGVSICLGSEVSVIEAGSQGIRLGIGQANERFDAVIVTAFIPDVMRMLDASGIEHRLTALDHTHLKAITMILDPREKILRIERPALYHSGGIGLLVQPKARRCIAVCIRGPSNDDEYVVSRVRRDLDLEFPLVDTWVRSNLLPEEGLYTADYVDPARILSKQVRGLYFAGSYVKNSYPVDSAEGACRTALNAVAALKRDLTQAPLAAGTSV